MRVTFKKNEYSWSDTPVDKPLYLFYFLFSLKHTHTHTQTHLLQECVENRALLSHVLLLQGSSEVLQGDVRAVSP